MISAPCGPDPGVHTAAIRYIEAGFDEVHISQVGGNVDGFFESFAADMLPRLRAS